MSTPKKEFVLTQVFENVNDRLFEKFSHDEAHFGSTWNIIIRKLDDEFLVLMVYNRGKFDDWWSRVKGNVEFKIISSNGRVLTLHREMIYDKMNWSKVMDWETFMEHYVVDGKVTITACVTYEAPADAKNEDLRKFDESVKDCSDVVLVVEGRKFYLSKMFLALQSSFFKSLLLGNFSESEKSEIELKDVNPNDFQKFLELLHGELSINDSTVEGILKLADMYDSPTALRRCENFLQNESKISLGKKLELSSRYNMESLKEKCLSEVNASNIQSIITAHVGNFDESILRKLLKKSISFL